MIQTFRKFLEEVSDPINQNKTGKYRTKTALESGIVV